MYEIGVQETASSSHDLTIVITWRDHLVTELGITALHEELRVTHRVRAALEGHEGPPGGTPGELTALGEGETSHRLPQVLPGGGSSG